MVEQTKKSEIPPEVSAFLEATEGFRPAMAPSLSFLAFRRDGRWEIFRSRFALNLPIVPLEPISVRTENILAGFELIDSDSDALRRFVETILAGEVEIGGETLHFPARPGGAYSTTFVPLHADGIANQNRTAVLQILGNDQTGYLSYAPLDWELRAAAEPYESVSDLISVLGLPYLPHVGALFEAVSFSFIAIDGGSRVEKTNALFRLRLCQGLDRTKASIGYRVISQTARPSRGRIDGVSLAWSDVDGVHLGEASLEVPAAALIHAYACYDGVAYQHWWFSDPSHSQNPRRAAYESADKGLENLQNYLQNGGKQSRDLEAEHLGQHLPRH